MTSACSRPHFCVLDRAASTGSSVTPVPSARAARERDAGGNRHRRVHQVAVPEEARGRAVRRGRGAGRDERRRGCGEEQQEEQRRAGRTTRDDTDFLRTAATELLLARLARLGHVMRSARGSYRTLAAAGGAVALGLRSPLEQPPRADRGRLDPDAGNRLRLAEDQREAKPPVHRAAGDGRDDAPAERDERALEGPRELGRRSRSEVTASSPGSRSPSSALPDHASSSSQIGTRASGGPSRC